METSGSLTAVHVSWLLFTNVIHMYQPRRCPLHGWSLLPCISTSFRRSSVLSLRRTKVTRFGLPSLLSHGERNFTPPPPPPKPSPRPPRRTEVLVESSSTSPPSLLWSTSPTPHHTGLDVSPPPVFYSSSPVSCSLSSLVGDFPGPVFPVDRTRCPHHKTLSSFVRNHYSLTRLVVYLLTTVFIRVTNLVPET